jgi:hypothetical protein
MVPWYATATQSITTHNGHTSESPDGMVRSVRAICFLSQNNRLSLALAALLLLSQQQLRDSHPGSAVRNYFRANAIVLCTISHFHFAQPCSALRVYLPSVVIQRGTAGYYLEYVCRVVRLFVCLFGGGCFGLARSVFVWLVDVGLPCPGIEIGRWLARRCHEACHGQFGQFGRASQNTRPST